MDKSMGSILYDFLDDSFLFAEKNIQNSLCDISDAELSAELQRYRDFCLKTMPVLAGEIESTQSDLRVFSGIEDLPINLLKQSAFYVEQFVLYDPLFAEARPPHSQSKAFSQYKSEKEVSCRSWTAGCRSCRHNPNWWLESFGFRSCGN